MLKYKRKEMQKGNWVRNSIMSFHIYFVLLTLFFKIFLKSNDFSASLPSLLKVQTTNNYCLDYGHSYRLALFTVTPIILIKCKSHKVQLNQLPAGNHQ